jgi:hypothetical protein
MEHIELLRDTCLYMVLIVYASRALWLLWKLLSPSFTYTLDHPFARPMSRAYGKESCGWDVHR